MVDGEMIENRISPSEFTQIQSYTRSLVWPLLTIFLTMYPLIIWVFSGLGSEQINWFQSHFINAPDLSKCEPGFTKIAAGHVAFGHLTLLACSTLLAASFFAHLTKRTLHRSSLLLLLTAVGFTTLASLPALSSDFVLSTGARRSHIDRTTFNDLCQLSFTSRLRFYLLGQAILNLFLTLLSLMIASIMFVYSAYGKVPGGLSSDPEIEKKQMEIRQIYGLTSELSDNSAIREEQLLQLQLVEKSKAKRSLDLGLALFFAAAMLVLPASGLILMQFARIYHNIAWEKAPATITYIGEQCSFQKRETGKGWNSVFVTACVDRKAPDSATLPDGIGAGNPKYWRVAIDRIVRLNMKGPDGVETAVQVRRDVVMPDTRPIGTEIFILRDSANPTQVDRIFGMLDVYQLIARLALTLALALGGYFFLLRELIRKRFPNGLAN